MKHAKAKKTFAAILVAILMTLNAGTAQAGPIGWTLEDVVGTIISPFVTTTGLFLSSTATTAASQKEAYLAAAGEAANYVAQSGHVAVTPLLQEVMGFEKTMVAALFGPEAANKVHDTQYARLVVVRVETQFTKPQ